MDIFTTIIGAVASLFANKTLEDNSRTNSPDISATASGQDSIAGVTAGRDVIINKSAPAPAPPERIDVPKETYDESLKNAVTAKALELQIAHDEEKALLQAELNELKNRQNDPEKAQQEEQEFKEKMKTNIERYGNEVGAEKMAEAQDALENGNFSKAIEFFTEIKKREELGEKRSALASFSLGEIAEQEVRWHDAAEHYARAAKLDPCFEKLIMAEKFALVMGNYDSALYFGLESQKAAIAKYGKESEGYASSLNNVGVIYQEMERHTKAKLLHEEALKIRKKVLKKNHPDIAASLCNLGTIYVSEGNSKEAEKSFKQALDIQKKALEENHPYTASTLVNLAKLYSTTGRYKKAEALFLQALDIQHALFGEKHPDIAVNLNNIGGLYFEQKQYKKAEPFCREALEICETILGPNHPDTELYKQNYEGLQKYIAANA